MPINAQARPQRYVTPRISRIGIVIDLTKASKVLEIQSGSWKCSASLLAPVCLFIGTFLLARNLLRLHREEEKKPGITM
jgi:hypothetical protein